MNVLMWESFAPGAPIRVGGHHYAERFVRRGDRVAWCVGPVSPVNLVKRNDETRRRLRLYRQGGESLQKGRLFAYAPMTLLPYRPYPLFDRPLMHRLTLRATVPRLRKVLARAGFERVESGAGQDLPEPRHGGPQSQAVHERAIEEGIGSVRQERHRCVGEQASLLKRLPALPVQAQTSSGLVVPLDEVHGRHGADAPGDAIPPAHESLGVVVPADPDRSARRERLPHQDVHVSPRTARPSAKVARMAAPISSRPITSWGWPRSARPICSHCRANPLSCRPRSSEPPGLPATSSRVKSSRTIAAPPLKISRRSFGRPASPRPV